MRLLLLILTLALLTASSFAYDNVGFAGAYLSTTGGETQGPLFGGGYGVRVAGNLWSYNYLQVGQYGNMSTELAYFVLSGTYSDSSIWALGLVAGPNADWLNVEGGDPVAYVSTAGGALFTIDVFDRVGLFGFGKYKFVFDGDTQYPDGWLGGGGLYMRF